MSCGNYGDPTAHPETLDILRYFRDNGTKNVSISSNGASRSPEWWAELASIINGPGGSRDNIKNYYGGRVTFSIDGLADTNHLYRIGAKWDRIVENVTAFINAVTFSTILSHFAPMRYKWLVSANPSMLKVTLPP